MALCVRLYGMAGMEWSVLTYEFWDEILKCDHSNESF